MAGRPAKTRRAPAPELAPRPDGDPLVELLPGIAYTLQVLPGKGRRFLEVSPQVEDLLGVLPAEWMASALSWQRQIHPDDAGWVVESVEKAEETGDLRVFEYRLLRRNGEVLWFRDLARRISPPGAPAMLYRGVLLDITDRKRAELALVRSSSSGSRHVNALGRLAGGIAHDFNNLLTAILGHAQLLEMELPPDHPHLEYARHIRTAGERAAQLVERLTKFSRHQPGAVGPIDLAAWLRRTAPVLRQTVPPGVEFQVSATTGEAIWINGEDETLEAALLHLVSNAVDARGGRIILSLEPVELSAATAASVGGHPGSYACLSVQDEGEGITAANLPRIFDPFFSTRETAKGTGLGLAIVQTTVHNHGGFIHVSSAPGKGTRFDLYLPRIAAGSAGADPVAAPDLPRGTETILLVDDDEDARESATRMLQGLGYRVLPAGNAGEAMLLAEHHPGPIELVITDIVMPLISGLKLIDRLRQIRPPFKVLYISGYSQSGVTDAHQAPALANFLQKPFDLRALAPAVRHAIET